MRAVLWDVEMEDGESEALAPCAKCASGFPLEGEAANAAGVQHLVVICPLCLLPWHALCAESVASVVVEMDLKEPDWEMSLGTLPEEFGPGSVCAMCQIFSTVPDEAD